MTLNGGSGKGFFLTFCQLVSGSRDLSASRNGARAAAGKTRVAPAGVTESVRERVHACTDLDRLEALAQRAVHVTDAAELFGEE
ncbi:hypothetical protein QZN11_16400 [Streptomyces gramineus]|uniref:hypothetical protein n=1 Tax=Streptomyces gramineus TaxID=910542 RepID=UPI00398B9B4F